MLIDMIVDDKLALPFLPMESQCRYHAEAQKLSVLGEVTALDAQMLEDTVGIYKCEHVF